MIKMIKTPASLLDWIGADVIRSMIWEDRSGCGVAKETTSRLDHESGATGNSHRNKQKGQNRGVNRD